MGHWNARLYTHFEAERTRPALDLLARVTLDEPATVIDLGCGPGNSTEVLAERFPLAAITGVDNSDEMLTSARSRLPDCAFVAADIADWRPDRPPNLIFANASLQWVPEHRLLLPRLLAMLAPGGVLAVQMPDNRDEPTHRLMRETATEAPWAAAIGDPAARRMPLLSLDDYYDLLAADAASVDIWRTTYYHTMQSAEAIVTWVRGTGLGPFLAPLSPDAREAFVERYTRKIEAAYPPRPDGHRLLAFPRLFFIARRPS